VKLNIPLGVLDTAESSARLQPLEPVKVILAEGSGDAWIESNFGNCGFTAAVIFLPFFRRD
jgi:hypothetical protein